MQEMKKTASFSYLHASSLTYMYYIAMLFYFVSFFRFIRVLCALNLCQSVISAILPKWQVASQLYQTSATEINHPGFSSLCTECQMRHKTSAWLMHSFDFFCFTEDHWSPPDENCREETKKHANVDFSFHTKENEHRWDQDCEEMHRFMFL